jgi:hypothetical protein
MAQDEKSDPRWGVLLGGRGLGTVTDLLLRKAQAGRAGAQGDDDYDVIGADGMVIGRIFKATTSPAVGTPWMWTLAYGDDKDQTPTHGCEATRQAAMQAFSNDRARAVLLSALRKTCYAMTSSSQGA